MIIRSIIAVKIYKKQRRKIVIKSRTAQIIFQTIYCTLGLVGTIACLGIFDDFKMFRWDFYVYFTNLSNFLCLGVMFAALIQTIKRKEDGFV